MSFLDGFLKKSEEKAEKSPETTSAVAAVAPTAADRETPAEAAPTETANKGPAITDDERRAIDADCVAVLREIYDPEIPVNIYELGLIYDIIISDHADVTIVMTLTSPHCPVAEIMPGEIEMKLRDLPSVADVKIELVWDPPWDMSMMSEAARLEMGFM